MTQLEQKMTKGALVWITGLAGAGKTTVAKRVYEEISKVSPRCVNLDGDQLREILGEQKYDLESRFKAAMIYSKMCEMLTRQGVNVVISTISLFNKVQEYNRQCENRYLEVLLEADQAVIETRRINLNRNTPSPVMGIHLIPEFPVSPDLRLVNNTEENLKNNVMQILSAFESKYGKW